jgi:hypothetical protein
MKMPFFIITFLVINITAYAQSEKTKKFILIKKTNSIPGTVNIAVINKLDEPLRAIAAYYSSMEGSNCDGQTCELTTALGLGKQGSNAHLSLLRKWFRNDATAKQLIAQECYLRPNSASTFSDYVYLTIERIGNVVFVKYKVFFYSHGEESYVTSLDDKLLIGKDNITVLKRKIWN